jgi:hypothetical protein
LRDDPIVNLVAGETWQAEPCPSLRNEGVRRPDHERHEECSEGQRGHHEYRQHDIAIWKGNVHAIFGSDQMPERSWGMQ